MHRTFILTVILVHLSVTLPFDPSKEPQPEEPEIGPKGMQYNHTTSCEEFGKYARFNPYSVINMKWFVFYYWAPPRPPMSFAFRSPTTRDMKYLRFLMKDRVEDNFNWKAPMLLMVHLDHNTTSLLVEVGDRGQYHLYYFGEPKPRGTLYKPMDVRIKQVGPNKYIGFMFCKDRTAYILSRIQEVPRQQFLQTEAAKVGYTGRKGKSYLYQGHEWMPMGEADEFEFWDNYLSDIQSSRY